MIADSGPLILVADGAQMMRDVMRTVLRSLNHHQVVEAESGRAALEAFRGAVRPRLAFIDMALQGPGGIDVLRALRSDYPETFLVMVSGGEHLASDLRDAVDNGADAFLVKPYRVARVQHALEKFHDVRPRVFPDRFSGVA
ncbi:response regulator [Ectothiorhodospiraceae bacterium WFHF3C12]|nr:response regulator [Ectothiorhodospiraceae bacterium WFHF3C12]